MSAPLTAARANRLTRAALAAVTFLTIVPIARRIELSAADVRNGSAVFPLVGAVVGAATGSLAWLGGLVAPHQLAGVVAVAVGVVLTGALHLDGLADTFDGFGGRDPDDRLRIMRDHAIGTYGAVAVFVVLIAKVAAFATLAGSIDAVWVGAAAGALSRVCGPVLLCVTPPPPHHGIHSAVFGGRRPVRQAAAVVALAVVVSLLTLGRDAWSAVLATALVLGVVAWSSVRRLGGVTGDVMGASSELIEIAVLTSAVIAVLY